MLKVLLIGSNPSVSSGSNLAFLPDTKSGKILQEWVSNIDADFEFTNVHQHKTDHNKPLSKKMIKDSLESLKSAIDYINPDRVVALGKTAETALKMLEIDFLSMPHPSGLNRQLNDKNFKEQKIKELAKYCTQASPET